LAEGTDFAEITDRTEMPLTGGRIHLACSTSMRQRPTLEAQHPEKTR
jgi:hypothetical protein